jgi:L-lactate dehydrogenase complex protein LldF
MVSEETHLNDALEREGVEVVETDLGEYIVQLRNDRPSHIIAPIIHLTRQDVGRVMEQRLNVPYSDDPQTLASIARQRLRQEFLRADMGISGANFGVADTGTICLVTNEGNGRMVTTMPRIHVVLMGIE